jgi:hypothetical protein
MVPLIALVIFGGQAWGPTGAAQAATVALDPDFAFGWPGLSPSKIAAGDDVKITVSAQAKSLDAPAVVTFVTAAVGPDGRSVEIARRAAQTFTAWQTRRYEVAWATPATHPTGATTLRFQLLNDAGAIIALREATLTVAGSGRRGRQARPRPRSRRAATRSPSPDQRPSSPASRPAST